VHARAHACERAGRARARATTRTFGDGFDQLGIGPIVNRNELEPPNVVGANVNALVLHVDPLSEHFEGVVDVMAGFELGRALRQEAAMIG
jgi:hypothetical protein